MSFTTTDKNVDETLTNNGFFPDVHIKNLQAVFRFPTEYSEELVCHFVSIAMLEANRRLEAFEKKQKALCFETLKDVPCEMIGEKTRYEHLYFDIIGNLAKAYIFTQYRTMTRRDEAENMAKEGRDTTDIFLTLAEKAICSFLGKTSITIY